MARAARKTTRKPAPKSAEANAAGRGLTEQDGEIVRTDIPGPDADAARASVEEAKETASTLADDADDLPPVARRGERRMALRQTLATAFKGQKIEHNTAHFLADLAVKVMIEEARARD